MFAIKMIVVVYNYLFDPDFAALLRRPMSYPNVTSERGDT